jgi:hypothetical protein
MKKASITLKLTKDHHVFLHGVTPMEVTVLSGLHAKNNTNENPVEVDEKTIADTGATVMKDGKPTFVADNRDEDAELGRLRRKYGRAVVDSIIGGIKNLPKDFAKGKSGASVAAELGVANPAGKATAFASPSAAGISETKAF